MKHTARGESRVANIAQGEAEWYICHETEWYICHKTKLRAIFVTRLCAIFVRDEAECYICHETLHQELYTFIIQTKWQCFKCFIVCYT